MATTQNKQETKAQQDTSPGQTSADDTYLALFSLDIQVMKTASNTTITPSSNR